MNKSDIIIFSTADWSTPYWTNKQHMAKWLAALGHRVLYIESFGLRKPKIQSATDWKRIIYRVISSLSTARIIESNIWVISPLVFPFNHGNKFVKIFNKYVLIKAIEKFNKEHNFSNYLVWTYHPYMLDVYKSNLKANMLIYHCVDDLSSVPGIDKELYISEEIKLLEKADIVFTTNKILENKCKNNNKETFFLPNVVDYEHFSNISENNFVPKDIINIPKPRVVYMGTLSEFKIDFKMLDEVIEAMPEYSFIFIGEEIEGQRNLILNKISEYKNSYFIGYKPYKLLPKYLSNMQLGIYPVKKNSYTDSMAPMKLLEYIAAGLPTVVSEIDYLNSFGSNGNIFKANTKEEFISAIKKAAQAGTICYLERLEIIKDNTWESRINIMMEILRENVKKSFKII